MLIEKRILKRFCESKVELSTMGESSELLPKFFDSSAKWRFLIINFVVCFKMLYTQLSILGLNLVFMLILILGGSRSGKSSYAQTLCEKAEKVIYLATAHNDESDQEMSARISRHKIERPSTWITVEEPLDIVSVINNSESKDTCFLVDCATVWLSNLMWEFREKKIEERQKIILSEVEALTNAAIGKNVVVVSNEVGSGIVPISETGRGFRDLQGFANQILAKKSEQVFLIIAGLPLTLKNGN